MEKKNKTTPLKVVRRESGYLLFSDSNTGKEGLESYLQHAADHFFDPHAYDGPWKFMSIPVYGRSWPPISTAAAAGDFYRAGTERAGMFPPVSSRQNSSTASNRNFTFP